MYMYMYRERETNIYIYIYIYVNVYIYVYMYHTPCQIQQDTQTSRWTHLLYRCLLRAVSGLRMGRSVAAKSRQSIVLC